MPAEHDNLVLFISPVDLADHVIARCTLGHYSRPKIKFKLDRRLVCEKTCDTAEVFVSHDHGRHDSCDIERSVVKSADGSSIKLRFVDPDQDVVVDKELVDLFADLYVG